MRFLTCAMWLFILGCRTTPSERVAKDDAGVNFDAGILGEETGEAARATELLGKLTTIADEDPLPHADAFDVLSKISEAIPTTMVHDIEEFDFQKGHAILHGLVDSSGDVTFLLPGDPGYPS